MNHFRHSNVHVYAFRLNHSQLQRQFQEPVIFFVGGGNTLTQCHSSWNVIGVTSNSVYLTGMPHVGGRMAPAVGATLGLFTRLKTREVKTPIDELDLTNRFDPYTLITDSIKPAAYSVITAHN